MWATWDKYEEATYFKSQQKDKHMTGTRKNGACSHHIKLAASCAMEQPLMRTDYLSPDVLKRGGLVTLLAKYPTPSWSYLTRC